MKEEFVNYIATDAILDDVGGILEIQNQNLLDLKNEKDIIEKKLDNNGFLIYPLGRKELEEIIKNNKDYIIKIAKDNNKIIGYILGYNLKIWGDFKRGWDKGLVIFDNKDDFKDKIGDILYGRHIALNKNYKNKNIGLALLGSLLIEATKRNYRYFLVEVLKKPVLNIKSMEFVEKNGFKNIGENLDKNGLLWNVYLKKL